MSLAVRRLQRRGHPVVGERLEAVQAHYRNAEGRAFTISIDARVGVDMQQLYRHLTEVVTETIDVGAAFEQLDALASESWVRKRRRLPFDRAVHGLLDVYWLEHHGYLVGDAHNGMLFFFSRPCPNRPGERVGFTRETLEPTRGQETAFARAIERASDGQVVKVPEDE